MNSLSEAIPNPQQLTFQDFVNESMTEEDFQKNTTPTSSSFTPDDKPTEAEIKEGRKMLDKILFKEYYTWWDAFVEEAKEDTYEQFQFHQSGAESGTLIGIDGANLTALDRFSMHCAKLLKKKSQIDMTLQELEKIVVGWYLLQFRN